MGQDSILNKEQELILEKLSKVEIVKSRFYFGGGTALSEVYLKHRESVDLDFFSDSKYNPQEVFSIISIIARDLGTEIESQQQETTQIYFFDFKERKLKLDFTYYPYKRLREGSFYKGLQVDSKFDIAANKLMLIGSQRIEVKDFVDLYFLLNEFSVWDLIEGVRVKFGIRIEPYMLAFDFMAVKDFEFLPRMHINLKLDELQTYFINEAKTLGAKSVE